MTKPEERMSESLFDGAHGHAPDSTKAGSPKPTPWKFAVMAALAVSIVVVIVAKSARKATLAGRTATEPKFFSGTVLAIVNGEPITLQELTDTLRSLPPQHRAAYEGMLHDFLEELIVRKLLLQEARKLQLGETEEYSSLRQQYGPQPGAEEQALILVLLRKVMADRVKVTDAELQAFYDEHKDELGADASFEDVKEPLRGALEQQKQYEAMKSYIAELRENATVSINEQWVEAQKTATADNPLDRALKTGKPVVADFGRGVCIPCRMMKPILEDLARQYAGRAEILLIEIDEHPALARRCRIRAIPTQIFYDGTGKETYRHEGFMPREDIVAQLQKLGVM